MRKKMVSQPPSSLVVAQPNNTLYVSNLDWGIKKPLLRRALYSLFTRHGKVLDLITLRRNGLRGQAWVIFDDVQAATAALQAENGYSFFGKDLKLSYAHEKSDRIAKRDGSYVPKAKRKKNKDNKAAATAAGGTDAPPPPPPPPPEGGTTTTTETTTSKKPAVPNDPPSHILFADNLPSDVNHMMLEMLFRQYSGYKEVRIPRPGLAFVEFDQEPHATLALQGLNGFKLTANDTLNLRYGKS